MARTLEQALAGDPVTAAKRLLGCTLVANGVTLRLVEVEAYAGVGEDPGSHAHRGRTPRNTSMFSQPGTLYVYFTYGMHFCANVACRPAGVGSAVLLRAGEVVDGVELARERRRGSTDRDLARGPARLAQCMGLDRTSDGVDLLAEGSAVRLVAGKPVAAKRILSGPRTGVAGDGAATPWRFWIDGEPTVSPYRPAVKRVRTGKNQTA
ncbi:DNA-3-methyladenine glycosylase [Fodinicola acaciae]|uniref:DNA-3-methyladenine glycosylase n=1 Tax=Fodinicola acaciae TaxID=2681555 RepID=UPI001C9E302C|nr:DNA-3-methyladenine glycosylase [Fodinicola acaciae]